MSLIDVSRLEEATLEELQKVEAELSRVRSLKLEERKRAILEQIRNLSVEYDLTYEEIVRAVRTTSKRGKAPPIYRNPENSRQTWSGKGKPPEWYASHPDKESLRIPGA